MKVTIPASLEVGGVAYRIRYDEQVFLRREGLGGQTRFSELEISLSDEVAPEKRSHTFLHEILHAIDEEYCNSKALDEKSTDAISSGLLQVLKQLGIEFVFEV